MSRHLRTVNRHSLWNPNLASPRNLRFGALVLMLVAVNQINDPLIDATFGEALLFWALRPVVLILGLWLADELVAKYLAGRLETPEWLKPVVVVTAIGLIPLAVTEALLEQHLPFRPEFLDNELWAYSPMLAFLGEFLTLASIVIPLHLLLWLVIDRRTHAAGAAITDESPALPEFLERASVRDVADVLALQAEEHYVRIFTEDGAEMIHCRFGDAVAAMPPEMGQQVHRSWWVAGHAVRSAKRGSRRWQLDLVTAITVPVSDSYVASVREQGWLKKRPGK